MVTLSSVSVGDEDVREAVLSVKDKEELVEGT